jgi:hypothetical protein
MSYASQHPPFGEIMKIICFVIICGGLLLLGESAVAQSTTQPAQVASWSFSAVAYTYIVPGSRSYVQPTITADREWLHLEARYNYEDLETGSLWIGYNFSIGDKISLNITPMLGGVFGKTNGIAPGLRGSLKWWRLEFFSEYEYVFNTRERADSFLSLWSELTLSPFDWLRVGLVGQRTLASERQQDVERGFLLGWRYKPVEVAGYVLRPNTKNPKYILAVSVEF